MALQAGIGALEGSLDYDPSGQFDNILMSAGAGIAGDLGGRMAGRVVKGISGLVQDITRPRGAAVNAFADAFEEAGGTTLAYQRMAPGSRAALLAERAAQGAQASINPPTAIRAAQEANDALFRSQAVSAVGLDPAQFDNLGPEFKRAALDQFNAKFARVADAASGAGQLRIGDDVASRLQKLPEIKELIDMGDMQDLSRGILSGEDWMTAREALMEAASHRMNNGRSPAGQKLFAMVDDLDEAIGQTLRDEFLPDYARLREQYRVFRLLERPNVINNSGEINVRSLHQALDSKGQGFGRTATAGGETVNPETRSLIDTVVAGDRPEFKAFRSSGTAENLAMDNALDSIEQAAGGLAEGNPMPAAGLLGRLTAPGIVGASQLGEGRMFQGLVNGAGPRAGALGAATGRGAIDAYLYPFVGSEDEREAIQ